MLQFRYRPHEGLRLFLDTRDLIGVVEADNPVSARELAGELGRRNARIVLTYTNVAELVPHTQTKIANKNRVRRIMDRIESIPHVFIRLVDLSRYEFRAAIDAFENGTAVPSIDPFVEQWWETFWKIPPRYMRYLEPEKFELLRTLTLPQQMNFLLVNPGCLRFDSFDQEKLAETVEDDRQRLGISRGSAKSFLAGVKMQFVRNGWPEPTRGVENFSDFVRATPSACIGWRISHDVYEEFRCNLTAAPKKNDIPDFSHIGVLPYVTHATFDRAWRSRCEQARDRMSKAGINFPEYDRIYPNLDAILKIL